MNWRSKPLSLLKKAFGSGFFYSKDGVRVLTRAGYAPSSVYVLLSYLVKKKEVNKIGFGVYRFKKEGLKEVREPSLPSNLDRLRRYLMENGYSVMFTGTCVLLRFAHLIPRRFVYLVYVLKGSGEGVKELLEKKKAFVLVDPSSEQFDAVLKLPLGDDVFIVRETSSLYGSKNGVASFERAFVDLYFESTRGLIFFPPIETGRIFLNLVKTVKLDVRKITKCAKNRGVQNELKTVISKLLPVPENFVKGAVKNDYTKSVLEAVGAELR